MSVRYRVPCGGVTSPRPSSRRVKLVPRREGRGVGSGRGGGISPPEARPLPQDSLLSFEFTVMFDARAFPLHPLHQPKPSTPLWRAQYKRPLV